MAVVEAGTLWVLINAPYKSLAPALVHEVYTKIKQQEPEETEKNISKLFPLEIRIWQRLSNAVFCHIF